MSENTQLTRLTALEMAQKLRDSEITSTELVKAHLDRIAEIDGTAEAGVHAFLHVNTDEALAVAAEVDQIRGNGGAEAEALHPLAGVPIALMDMFVTTGQPTTAGSAMLEGWVSPYDASVVTKIREAKLPILGKTNQDEFGMGSTTEFSAFGPTRNPWNLERTPGGAAGGSAAAVAAFLAPLALGTDTGGSVRVPAAHTGTVGVKPTYGAISRYGAVATGSSMDTVGPIARTVADAAALQQLLVGHDPKDATSINHDADQTAQWGKDIAAAAEQGQDLSGMKIGMIKNLGADQGFSAEVLGQLDQTIAALKAAGAQIVDVELPHLNVALSVYRTIMPAEASSNLARYVAVSYGKRVVPANATIDQVMSASRGAGFGPEVKRSVILGTHVLSAGHLDAQYTPAQKLRTLIINDLQQAFEQVDALISPTTPEVACGFGERVDNPAEAYRTEIATVPANLAGIPAISVPAGLIDGLPVGVQIQAGKQQDALVYRIGAAVEAATAAAHDGAAFSSLIPNDFETGAKN